MKRGIQGYYVPVPSFGEECRAYLPRELPPMPAVDLAGDLGSLLEQATFALGRLDGLSLMLPDASLFLYSYVRKEALLSSQIEGTQSSLSDLLLFELHEIPGAPLDDVQEVSNYVAALEHGIALLNQGLPISLRLIREVHAVMLSKGRGSKKEPGEFKRSQNWIGGTRPGNAAFVPTPPDQVIECMGALEKFLHEEKAKLPLLIKAGLAHVQFETIHPFLDGNGRVGRLLITLLLYAAGALRRPLLYLSLYLKQHRSRYYELLQEVRLEGNWEAWLGFFLTGIQETAEGAVSTAQRLIRIFDEDRKTIEGTGRAAGSLLRLHHFLQQSPITSISKAGENTGLSAVTLGSNFRKLLELGMVREITGGKYGRLYAYQAYLEILSEGAEPLTSER